MSFGNKLGVEFSDALSAKELFCKMKSAIRIAEVSADGMKALEESGIAYSVVATVLPENAGFVYKDVKVKRGKTPPCMEEQAGEGIPY